VTEFDLFNVIPLIGVIVGMLVGLVGIWNTIKTRQRETKKDIEESTLLSENRIKEFMEVRFKVVDAQTTSINQRLDRQLGDLKELIKDDSNSIRQYIKERESFFKDWIQRVEDEIDTKRHDRTQK